MNVQVECYSGYKAGERPVRFRLGTNWLAVQDVVDRWYDPDAFYFRLLADDGNLYILRHSGPDNRWTIEAYRRQP